MEKKKAKKVSPPQPKRLVRSKTDVVLGGVCAGIANYFDMDPVIVRVLFAIVGFTAGSGVLIYIVLWIVMPEEGDSGKSNEEVISKNSKQVESKFEQYVSKVGTQKGRKLLQVLFGLALMFFGAYLVLDNFGFSRYFHFLWSLSKLWPLFIIFFGLYLLFKKDE